MLAHAPAFPDSSYYIVERKTMFTTRFINSLALTMAVTHSYFALLAQPLHESGSLRSCTCDVQRHGQVRHGQAVIALADGGEILLPFL